MIRIAQLPNSKNIKPVVLDAVCRADSSFFPPLSTRVCLSEYIDKVLRSGYLIGAWNTDSPSGNSPDSLIGLVFGYAQDGFDYAYSSFLWADPNSGESCLGFYLHKAEKRLVRARGKLGIRAKTWLENNSALLNFYRNLGYKLSEPIWNQELKRHDVELELTFK